jgi:hypothetical protein
MHAFLLAIGVIATAIGMFTIGFGIPINEFSFGNTLIIAGTTSVTGGLIVIGVAAAVRELRRIADGMNARAPMRTARADSADIAVRSGSSGARPTFPPKPSADGPNRDGRTEPRLATVFSNDAPVDDSVAGRPRPNIFPLVRAVDGTVVDETESVPLSPHAPARVAAPARGERDGKSVPQPAAKAGAAPAPAARSAVLEAPRAEAVGDRLGEKQRAFDTIWPVESKSGAAPVSEAVARAPKPEPVRPRERVEPVLAADKREQPAARPVDTRPVSILKSGVIDGMAYTLYTDGSIEAQLQQGMMRFDSIDDLRAHLENNP